MTKKIKKTAEEIMQEDFDRLPPLPKEFDETVEKLLAETRRLFYKRIGSKAEYHCTHCGADYILRTGDNNSGVLYPGIMPEYKHKIPVENELDRCNDCNTVAILKPKRRWRWDDTWREIAVWQCVPEGMIFRSFYAKKEDCIDDKEKITVREHFRAFFYMHKYRYYCFTYGWCDREPRWCRGGSPNSLTDAEVTLGNPYHMYKLTELRYCPLERMYEIANRRYYSPDSNKMTCRLFQTYCHFPGIEMEVKIKGLEAIATKHIMTKGVDGWLNKRAKNAADIYKVYPERVKQLRGCSLSDWRLLQFEREKGYHFNDIDYEFLRGLYSRHYESYIKILLEYMTPEQMKHRIEKYKLEKNGYGTDHACLMHYCDYLEMRKELGYDMTNSVFIYPRNLKKSHDKMVKEKKDRANDMRIKEVLQRFDSIPKKYRKLNKRYSYEAHGYIIRPAKDAAEIVREGWTLHHCVGGDGYLNKHNTGMTAILFLRSVDSPDKSYVTIEVCEDRILQWYGAHDKKDVTKEAKKCIEEFENMLKSKGKRTKKTENQTRLRIAV